MKSEMTTVYEALKYETVVIQGDDIKWAAGEWEDNGFKTGEDCSPWWDAGCWDAGTAHELRFNGFDPESHTLNYKTGEELENMDAMYALCNGDILIDKLEW